MTKLDELKKFDVVNVKDFGKMEYRGVINQKGDMTFLGRGQGKKSKSIVTLTINKSNILVDEKNTLVFKSPYKQYKEFEYSNRLNKDIFQVHNYTQLDIYLKSKEI